MKHEDEAGLKELHRLIIDSIVKHSNFKEKEIEELDIEEMEGRMKIIAAPPRHHFQWERGEKLGWQTRPYKFVPLQELNRREERLKIVLEKN